MAELNLDGRRVAAADGATILEAARAAGTAIPTLCFLEGFPHHTSCMVCLVEDIDANRLVPACVTPASAVRRVRTDSARVLAARRRSVELLLSEHDGDCEAPCTRACPAHADIPGMIRRVAAGDPAGGDPAGALAKIMERLPLAGTLARVCPAPCERSCNRRLVDSAVEICSLKRAVVDPGLDSAEPFTPPRAPLSGKAVAIVGAGPAGLSAAYFLSRAGHRCVVFDGQPRPGGALRAGAGPDRLPASVLDADVAVLGRLGVELRMGHPIAPGSGLDALRASFDAVVLATGTPGIAGDAPASAPMPAGVPGLFICGNAARAQPSRLAVRAVADGRKAALQTGLFLAGLLPEPALVPASAPAPRQFDSHRRPLDPGALAVLKARADGRGAGRAGGVGAAAEVAEAERCLQCDCARRASCRLRRVATEVGADANRFAGERAAVGDRETGENGLSFEPGKCIKCGICVRIAERAGDRPGLAFSGRGAEVRVRVPFDEDIGRAIAAAGSECVARCPTGALAWDRSPAEGGQR